MKKTLKIKNVDLKKNTKKYHYVTEEAHWLYNENQEPILNKWGKKGYELTKTTLLENGNTILYFRKEYE